jgi:bacteriocin-like protein
MIDEKERKVIFIPLSSTVKLIIVRKKTMAEIKLSELRPAGSDLLQDSESFLNELNDRELENVVGGNTIASVASQASASVGSILSVTDVGISQTFVTF